MHRNRNQLREEFYLTGDSISEMLRSAKIILSAKQYKDLRRAVNATNGYADKKGLIFASVQAKAQKKRGESRQDAGRVPCLPFGRQMGGQWIVLHHGWAAKRLFESRLSHVFHYSMRNISRCSAVPGGFCFTRIPAPRWRFSTTITPIS